MTICSGYVTKLQIFSSFYEKGYNIEFGMDIELCFIIMVLIR